MTAAPDTSVARSATTGEPVSVVERRNRLGVWLCIVSDITGTVALLIAYAYLWSLNVNSAWAPPGDAWAPPLPFWLITLGAVVACLLLWWGDRGLRAGNHGRMVAASGLATLIVLITFVGQIWQLSTFPFGPSDGAYASATFWLALGSVFHLSIVLTLALAVFSRTRKGLISPANPYHGHLVAMYMTWVAIAIFLGSVLATTMTDSPNANSPTFGDFVQVPASSAPASSAAPSGSASPAAAPSASAGS